MALVIHQNFDSSIRFLFCKDKEDIVLAARTFLTRSLHRPSSLFFSCCALNLNCLSQYKKIFSMTFFYQKQVSSVAFAPENDIKNSIHLLGHIFIYKSTGQIKIERCTLWPPGLSFINYCNNQVHSFPPKSYQSTSFLKGSIPSFVGPCEIVIKQLISKVGWKGLITCKGELCKSQVGRTLMSEVEGAATAACTASTLRSPSSCRSQNGVSTVAHLDTWRIYCKDLCAWWAPCHMDARSCILPCKCAPGNPLPHLAVDTNSVPLCAFSSSSFSGITFCVIKLNKHLFFINGRG